VEKCEMIYFDSWRNSRTWLYKANFELFFTWTNLAGKINNFSGKIYNEWNLQLMQWNFYRWHVSMNAEPWSRASLQMLSGIETQCTVRCRWLHYISFRTSAIKCKNRKVFELDSPEIIIIFFTCSNSLKLKMLWHNYQGKLSLSMFQTLSGRTIGKFTRNCCIIGLCATFSSRIVGRHIPRIGLNTWTSVKF